MMRIAVVGAGGFVGSRIVELGILSGRFDVQPIIRSPKSAAKLGRFGPIWSLVNTSSVPDLTNAIRGCDAVVNATVGDYSGMAQSAGIVWDACKAGGVPRLIHLGTAEVFGRVSSPDIGDDSWPDDGHWMPYARAKGAAETVLRGRFADSAVACSLLRPGLIWGPRSPWVEGPAKGLLAGSACLVGDGEGVCNLIYLENLIEQILAVAADPAPASSCYNISDDETTSWKTYMVQLAERVGVDPESIHRIPNASSKADLASLFDAFKSSFVGQWLKRGLTRTSKRQIRMLLQRLAPPVSTSGPSPRPGPNVSRALVHLQTVQHKLPNAKFRLRFGRTNELTFSEAMDRTAEWLKYSGFTLGK